jgi:hypothetical protein
MTSKLRTDRRRRAYFVGDANSIRTAIRGLDIGAPADRTISVQIFALQPHLHVELEVVFLSIRTYGIVDLELLIVFVHLELAAGTSLGLNRRNELCAFVLGNLAIGEGRQGGYGEYGHRYDQSHGLGPPVGGW